MANVCIVYSVSNNSSCANKIGSYYGVDLESKDSAMCAGINNADKNLFYFKYPDMIPKHNYCCGWCSKACAKEFCSGECRDLFDLDLALQEAEKAKPVQRIETLKYYKFTSFNFEID